MIAVLSLLSSAMLAEPRHEIGVAAIVGPGMTGAETGSDSAGPGVGLLVGARAEYGVRVGSGFRLGVEGVAARTFVECMHYLGCPRPDGFYIVAPGGFIGARWVIRDVELGPRIAFGYGVGGSYSRAWDGAVRSSKYFELGAELAWKASPGLFLRASLFGAGVEQGRALQGEGLGIAAAAMTIGVRYRL